MTITAVFNKLFNLDEGCLFYRFNNADGKMAHPTNPVE